MSLRPSPQLRGNSTGTPRTRVGISKSRLGCKTCKIRRVKCGEEKPNCLRCTSTGRKCDYESTQSISTLANPLSLSPNTAWSERRAFAYYFQHAAASVGGGLDVDFWRTIVPQVCQDEPAVWDAINSISALFESPKSSSDIVHQNRQAALGWYSRSVSSIRQRIESGRLDIFIGLISCILFICIEAIQGGEEEALRLYSQGVHLVLALRAQIACGTVPATKASLLEDTITPILIRLGAIALTISGVPVSALLRDTEYQHALTQGFLSLRSAREAIVVLATEAQIFQCLCRERILDQNHFTSPVPQDLVIRQRTLSVRLQSWHTAFTDLMESLRLRTKDVLSLQERGTIALLTAYHEMLSVILAVSLSPFEIITDAYIPNFQNIVEQSSIALDSLAQSDGTQPPFTFEMSVGFPLWFTCLRCREPRIRRTALTLLRRAPEVLGVYKRNPAVDLGEKIMMLEESHGMALNTALKTNSMVSESTPTSVLIPEEARIGPIGVVRARDGFPPGMTEENTAKWSPDQTLLRVQRNKRDIASDTWRVVYEFIPLDS